MTFSWNLACKMFISLKSSLLIGLSSFQVWKKCRMCTYDVSNVKVGLTQVLSPWSLFWVPWSETEDWVEETDKEERSEGGEEGPCRIKGRQIFDKQDGVGEYPAKRLHSLTPHRSPGTHGLQPCYLTLSVWTVLPGSLTIMKVGTLRRNWTVFE